MRLRQVALVARELDPVVADCGAVLGIEVGFRDPEIAVFGLRNAVMPVGDTFLEVVSPARDGTTAGRFLERRGGDGGYMVIVQTDDLDVARRRLAALGVRVVFEATFDDVATVHLHPRDVGGAILSLDIAEPPESWRWAGPTWREHVRTDVSAAITGVEIAAADPAAMAARWAAVLGCTARECGDGTYEVALDDAHGTPLARDHADGASRVAADAVRFAPARDGRGDGLTAVDVRMIDRARALAAARERGLAIDGDEISLGGVRMRLH